MADLMKLAERVEALTGKYHPIERELAKDIYRLIIGAPEPIVTSGYGWREDDSGWWLATGEDGRILPKSIYPPRWLRSLDAAMTLVPGNCLTLVKELWNADLVTTSGYAIINRYEQDGETKRWNGDFHAACATPALALCAAALRARASNG